MTTKLYDLTQTQVWREMHRTEADPLADPQFRRHVHTTTTDEQRTSQAERLRRARRAA